MARQSKAQKQVIERVMHEFKHGELASSSGRNVTNPQQAIAIGLHEAGASAEQTPREQKAALRRTRARERKGETARQRDERDGPTRAELYAQAKKRDIPGRSKMDKAALARALGR